MGFVVWGLPGRFLYWLALNLLKYECEKGIRSVLKL